MRITPRTGQPPAISVSRFLIRFYVWQRFAGYARLAPDHPSELPLQSQNYFLESESRPGFPEGAQYVSGHEHASRWRLDPSVKMRPVPLARATTYHCPMLQR